MMHIGQVYEGFMEVELMVTKRDDDDRRRRQGEYKAVANRYINTIPS